MYQHIKVPAGGQKISVNADFSLNVPEQPAPRLPPDACWPVREVGVATHFVPPWNGVAVVVEP